MKVLLSRRTITPSGIGPKCVWIEGEVITRVDDYVDPSSEKHKAYFSSANEGIFDYGDLILAPGLVDDDRVPWPDDSTLHLIGCLPPRVDGAWLDLGAGPAAAAPSRRAALSW